MSNEPLRRLLQSLRQWGEQADQDALSDAELLERFRVWRDQAAFELLLWRHGPMVLGVCRRLLPTAQDAEDAFQAVWLTFVRKARSISRGGALGGWLHQVACRVALRARAGLARRARREHDGVEQLGIARQSTADFDLGKVLDEEVNRLPARQRLAFVLCCLEGKTGAEAARQLGCTPGTVSSRLTRARVQLRRRLTRRGLAPALALVVAEGALSAPLIQATLKACFLFAGGKSAGGELSVRAVTLAEGVLRAMFLSKLKIVAVLLLAVGMLVASRAFIQRPVEAAPAEEAKPEAPPKPQEKKDRPVVVEVVQPQKGGLDRKSVAPCNVQAFQTVDMYTEVSGTLKTLSVDMGSRVRKGDVLAEVDAPLLALEEKQALSAVKQAHGQLQVARAAVEGARARVIAAKATFSQRRAELDRAQTVVTSRQRVLEMVKRQRQMANVSMTTQVEKEEQLEAARGDAQAAGSALERAKADIVVREGEVAEAEAAVAAAEGGLEVARVSLAKARLTRDMTRLRAPFDGIVSEVGHRVGDQVLAGERRRPQPLLRLMRIDRMRAVTQVVDRDVPFTRVGLPVTLAINALPGVVFPDCKVSRISYSLDEKTSTMRVEIDVPNPQEKLFPGMFGSAGIVLARGPAEALRIPLSCFGFAGKMDRDGHVFVVRGGKAQRAGVKVGRRDGEMVEILSGLEPTDQVILVGSGKIPVKEGEPVEIRKEAHPK